MTGRRPFPVLTVVVLAVTAATSVAGLLVPGVLLGLRRDAALVADGQVWRLVTALLVQDGGVPGTLTNLLGLAVLGVLAERTCGRLRWAIAYPGAAAVGEVVGWAGWQPVGAGNSVGVCGLAALVAVSAVRRGDGAVLPAAAVVFWSIALLGGSLGSPLVTVVLCAAVVPLVRLGRAVSAAVPGRVALGTTAVVALILLVRSDIHGAALAAGLVVAAVAGTIRRTGGTVAARDPSVCP